MTGLTVVGTGAESEEEGVRGCAAGPADIGGTGGVLQGAAPAHPRGRVHRQIHRRWHHQMTVSHRHASARLGPSISGAPPDFAEPG